MFRPVPELPPLSPDQPILSRCAEIRGNTGFDPVAPNEADHLASRLQRHTATSILVRLAPGVESRAVLTECGECRVGVDDLRIQRCRGRARLAAKKENETRLAQFVSQNFQRVRCVPTRKFWLTN